MGTDLINTESLVGTLHNDIGKSRIPPHFRAGRQLPHDLFVVFFGKESRNLEDFPAGKPVDILLREAVYFEQIAEEGNLVVFFVDRHALFFHKDTGKGTHFFLVTDQAVDIACRNAFLEQDIPVGIHTIRTIQCNIPVEGDVAQATQRLQVATGSDEYLNSFSRQLFYRTHRRVRHPVGIKTDQRAIDIKKNCFYHRLLVSAGKGKHNPVAKKSKRVLFADEIYYLCVKQTHFMPDKIMRRFSRITASACLLFCTAAAGAKAPLEVKEYLYAQPASIVRPFIVDKEDVNSNSWSNKNLLQSDIDISRINEQATTLHSDTAGWIVLPQDSLADRLHLLQFSLIPDRYVKAQLEITGTGLFEVFVNQKKEKNNTHKAIDIDDADPAYINLSLLPQQYLITIKYLSEKGSSDTLRLKASLKISGDTLASVDIAARSKRPITINDMMEGERLSAASISPSGQYYLVGYRAFYPTEKSYSWYELRDMKKHRILQRFPASISPRWMPSSDRLYFWRKGKTDYDLVAQDIQSMEEEILLEGIEVQSAAMAPNEKFLIIARKDKAPQASGNLKRLLAPDDRIEGFRDRNSLYLYNIADKSLSRLTFGQTDTYLGDISEDSRKILFFTSQRELSQQPFSNYSCYIMYLDDLRVDTLLNNDRYINAGSFSPDGKQVLFRGHPEAFGGIGLNVLPGQIANGYDTQAFILDIESKEVKAITRDFNPSIARAHWWPGDGKIYLRTSDKDREQMYRYDPKSGIFEHLNLREDVVDRFSLPTKGNAALYTGQSIGNSTRLHTYDLKSGKSTLLSDPFAPQLNEIKLGEVKDFHFDAGNGTIEGRYYLPPNFDPDKKYPLIVYYYGGTTPTTRLFESRYPLNVYAALGYVVYTLQPSGAIGYGQEFSARHVNAWGKQTATDIIEGTKRFCETHPFVDKKKIGCIGASYGGFMTQYLQTQTDIFAAAVSHAGISNLASYWGEGYWGYSYSSMASTGSYPWNNPELYVEQSPLFHADKINTPLLLLHGSVDTNVPIGESIQMYNALKILGKEVEFIQVAGENHAISAYRKRLEWNRRIYAWFAKWLKDEPEWWKELD